MIDHEDLDRVAAEGLVGPSPPPWSTLAVDLGRYPNVGPLLLAAAGIPLVDDVGAERAGAVHRRRRRSPLDGDELVVGGDVVATRAPARPSRRSRQAYERRRAATSAPSSSAFAENTLEYIRREAHLFLPGQLDGPRRRRRPRTAGTCSIVVRGDDYREDLRCCAGPATSARCGRC